jgi:NAD(P)-dependent dehydrogenase (short-subunit alcohol dehydrogenase family)
MQKLFDLTGKTAFITGGAGLLGRQHAEAIIEAGGHAVIADYNLSAARQVSDELGDQASAAYIDVNSRHTVESAMAKYDRIDILINNAAKDPKVKKDGGIDSNTKFESMTEEYWLEGISTILNGTFLCSQAASNKMLQTGGGVILNIASDLGVIAPDQRIYDKNTPKPITYSAAKWGLIGMTKYLATYFADRDIRVNSLSPSGVRVDQPNEFVQRLSSLIPMGRMAHVDEYKGAIIFLCSDASSYMTGANLIIDGGRTVW